MRSTELSTSFPTCPTSIVDRPDADSSDLSDLPGINNALASKDSEIVIKLVGDNDVTSGDDDDLIVTGQGDDLIDAGDGDNAVYAECRSGLDRELCRRR